MAKASFSEKLRYNFDNTLSKGPIAIISWLALVTFLLVILAGVILFITGLSADPELSEPLGLLEGIWQSLMRVLDAGTVTGDEGWTFRLFMLIITIAGLFIFSSLIGSISLSLSVSLANLIYFFLLTISFKYSYLFKHISIVDLSKVCLFD